MSVFDGLRNRLGIGQAYTGIGSGDEEKENAVVRVVKNVAMRGGMRIKAAIAFVVLVLVLLGMKSRKSGSLYDSIPQLADPREARYLHVLIPATKKDANLCKTLVSAAVCNYPIPTLFNWGAEFNDGGLVGGGSHIGKVSSMLDWLNSHPPDRDGDLVLMVDGYDVWFQLQPGVLIERYLEINRKANKRIKARLGKEAAEKEGVRQSVVFSTQKRCWPREADDLGCYALPESTLPKDVYGPATDLDAEDKDNPDVKYRPRYLSSGVGMGELLSLKKLFARVLERMKEDPKFGSDQNVISQIFGEQEFQREVIRERYLSGWQRFNRFWGLFQEISILSPHSTHRKMDPADGAPFEFGVGLDYESLLGHATEFAEYDSDWVRYNDTKQIAGATKKLGITPQRVKDIPADIMRQSPAFWSPNGPEKDGLPADLDWTNLPLHSNLWTGAIPATIHLNAHIHDMKSLRESSWDRLWFQPYARKLLDAHINTPYRAVATVKQGDKEVSWWPMYEDKWHLRNSDYENPWISWEQMMAGYEDEVFRDGRGAWKPPRMDF